MCLSLFLSCPSWACGDCSLAGNLGMGSLSPIPVVVPSACSKPGDQFFLMLGALWTGSVGHSELGLYLSVQWSSWNFHLVFWLSPCCLSLTAPLINTLLLFSEKCIFEVTCCFMMWRQNYCFQILKWNKLLCLLWKRNLFWDFSGNSEWKKETKCNL